MKKSELKKLIREELGNLNKYKEILVDYNSLNNLRQSLKGENIKAYYSHDINIGISDFYKSGTTHPNDSPHQKESIIKVNDINFNSGNNLRWEGVIIKGYDSIGDKWIVKVVDNPEGNLSVIKI
jgi:hypothetical protein